MSNLTADLLARIATRARDPQRRYMMAAEDETAVVLPVEEIERRLENGLPGGADSFRRMREQMKAWGFDDMSTMSFTERADGGMYASGAPPGAKPLAAPPSDTQWRNVEQVVGRPMPADLKQLYSIADGGFGPGFQGLLTVSQIGPNCEDFRRRGPDYCCQIFYPGSFMPIALETLDYHYDLDTGRIISSNQHWVNEGLEHEDIYDIAFPDLAAMMEHWLES